jgi:hypothetical protein
MSCDFCEYNKDYLKENGFVYPECSHPDVRADWYGNRPIDTIISRKPDWCPLEELKEVE